MKEALAFLWLIRFIGMDLGDSNSGMGSVSMIYLPLFGSKLDSETASDS
jgi:hypothetical protein